MRSLKAINWGWLIRCGPNGSRERSQSGFQRVSGWLWLLLLGLLPALGASEAFARDPAQTKQNIDLGALITLSPTGDPDTQAAIRLAVEDVNAFFSSRRPGRGRWPQLRIRLDTEGTGLDPDAARAKIEQLAQRGLTVVIGPESSAEVEAIKPFTDANRMVLISHCSTAPSLAIPGDSVYRLVPSDLRQGIAIARLIDGNGHRAIIPMWREGTWGDGISSATITEFIRLGGKVYPGVRFNPDKSDFADELAALAEQVAAARAEFGEDAAVAFFSFGTEGAAMLAQAAGVPTLDSLTWYGSDGTALSREILNDPPAAQFAVRTGFFNTLFADAQTALAESVRQRVSAAIGGGSVHFCALAAYDAVWLAALSAAVAGAEDRDAFVRAFVGVAALYNGATGRTRLDAAGDRAVARYDVWAVREEAGRYEWSPADSFASDLAR